MFGQDSPFDHNRDGELSGGEAYFGMQYYREMTGMTEHERQEAREEADLEDTSFGTNGTRKSKSDHYFDFVSSPSGDKPCKSDRYFDFTSSPSSSKPSKSSRYFDF